MKKWNIKFLILLITAVLMISVISCDPGKKYEKEEQEKIQDYIVNNPEKNFIMQQSGLYYMEVKAGSGRMPVVHDTAYMKYTGKFLDGEVFSSNIGTKDTLIAPLGEGWLIAGLEEGITLMKEGGKATLLIPSKLAYGATGYYSINSYTPIIYDIDLVRVVPGP
jgi:FKBP-type peptidyl-prolyl cis-trans isomerase FkpA